MSRGEESYRVIREGLHRIRQNEKGFRLLTGSLWWLVGILILVVFLSILESLCWFSPTGRILLCLGFISFAFIQFFIKIVLPFYSLLFQKHIPHDDSLALRLGAHFPSIKDRLADSLQVYRNRPDRSFGTSSELAEAALVKTTREIVSLDFSTVVSKKPFYRSLKWFSGVMLSAAVLFFAAGQTFNDALNRLLHPQQSFVKPVSFLLILKPGNIQVVEGDSIILSVEIRGNAPEKITLFTGEDEAYLQPNTLSPPFRYFVPEIRKDIFYYARSGKVRTPTSRIKVLERPLVRNLSVTVTPPAYTRMLPVVQESNNGDITALKGSLVSLKSEANKPLKEAMIRFQSGSSQSLAVSERIATGSFRVLVRNRYQVDLWDTDNIQNSRPISYPVHMTPDLYPLIRLLSPEPSVDLDESMRLALTVEGEDDYGILKCRLGYRIKVGEEDDESDTIFSFIPVPLEETEPVRFLLNTIWDMDTLNLFPEDVVSYFVEVWDNDRISGPKITRTSLFSARFPSMLEIFQEVEAEQANQRRSLEAIYDESIALESELYQISEEIKAGKALEWEEKRNLQEITQKQQGIEKELNRLEKDLQDMVDQLRRNDLLDLETLMKYQELQELYQEIATPELNEAMKRLNEAMNQMNQDVLKQAAQQFQMNQEIFKKSIERTLSLLKRLQIEQKTDEIIRRMENLTQRQTDLNQQISETKKESSSEMIRQQKEIHKDSESLQGELEELHQMMSEFSGMPLLQMEAIREAMEREGLLNQMNQTVQNLQSGAMGEAEKSGNQARQTLEKIKDMMEAMQQNMQMYQKEEIANALMRISYRLLQLSQGQEDLIQESEKGNDSRQQYLEQQLSLLKGVRQVADSLAQLSQKTFFITPEIGRAVGEADALMQETLQNLEQDQNVSPWQKSAMGVLNRGVIALQNALGRMQSMQSGLGMEQFMEQMEQMAQQQIGINQQTLDLLNQGQLSLEQQAAMTRLGQAQAALQKALEFMLQKMGGQDEVTGRLDRMIREMEDVVQDLKGERASRETIRRQERILSRLLDLQHSVHRRDYSRRREAVSGEDVRRRSPDTIDVTEKDIQERLRRDIMRMSKEGYTREYQELIRKYFETLTREKEKLD